jgi:hypothetical protein
MVLEVTLGYRYVRRLLQYNLVHKFVPKLCSTVVTYVFYLSLSLEREQRDVRSQARMCIYAVSAYSPSLDLIISIPFTLPDYITVIMPNCGSFF